MVGKNVSVVVEQNNLARAEDFSYVKFNDQLEIGKIYNLRIVGYENTGLIGEL
jgi:tRNA A37 methylthiotransferase MiaB